MQLGDGLLELSDTGVWVLVPQRLTGDFSEMLFDVRRDGTWGLIGVETDIIAPGFRGVSFKLGEFVSQNELGVEAGHDKPNTSLEFFAAGAVPLGQPIG